MRAVPVVVAILLAGCFSAPSDDAPGVQISAPTAPTEGANVSTPQAPVGERMVASMERFVLLDNRTIDVLRPDAPPMPETKLPEPLSGAAFYTSLASGVTLRPFVSFPFRSGFETTGEFDIAVSFVSSAPAAPTVPAQSGVPTVGGWFGTPERFAYFLGATDAPATLEANKVYTANLRVPFPPGGFFVREGESVALTLFFNYQPADGSQVAWVLGGAEPAGFALPHAHFNISAPNAVVVLEESGETGPNVAPTGDQNMQPALIPFSVPPEAVYVVLEVSGAPKAGTTIDIDAAIRGKGGDTLASGTSPLAREVVVIGPGALASAGRDLVAYVTSAGSASGGTFQVKVTAYVP